MRTSQRRLGTLACTALLVSTFGLTAAAVPLDQTPDAAAAAADAASPGFLDNGVTAHRGYSSAYPENTFEAFQRGLDLGVDWLELDIFTTADGQIVVSHDATTGRFADRNLRIADSTYAELATLDVAHGFRTVNGLSEKEVPPARMPLLSEVLEMVQKQDRTRVSLQPKDGSTPAAVAMVRQLEAQKWVGFNDGNLAKMSQVKELDPSIHVFWDLPANGDLDAQIATALDRGFESLVVNENGITPEVINKIQAAGMEAGAWTVNNTATMQRFIGWGIDRLYTDSADQALMLFGHDTRTGLQHGILGHWSFNDGTGRFADDDGSANPLRDGRLQANAALTAQGKGQLKGAVTLDGQGDYVDVPFQVLPDGAPAYTASAWFKPAAAGSGQRQFILETSGSWAISVELAATTGHLKFSIQTTGTSVVAESDTVPEADAWHHLAVSFDGATGQSRLYLDGQEITGFSPDAKETASGTLAPTDGLHIGSYRGGDARYFNGSIDDAGVWNRVLTDAELAGLWNEGDGAAVAAGFTDKENAFSGSWSPRN